MKRSFLKKIFAVSLVAVMSMSILAGCGGNKSEGAAKQIVYNIGADPKSIDPGLNQEVESGGIIINAFEGLYSTDEKEQPVPAVAESCDISEDGLTYTFHLVKDAKWCDGEAVTAKDFEYAWKRALDPNTASEYAYQLYYLKNAEAYNKGKGSADEVGVKATDDYTLEVTLENPTSYFLALTAFPTYMPVRQDVIEKYGDKWATQAESYISNGAFKMTEFSSKDKMVFVKNENYRKADSVKIEQLTYKMIEDNTTAWASYKTGDLDMTAQVPTEEVQTALADGIATKYEQLGSYSYAINMDANTLTPEVAKALTNKDVRKALALAINKKEIVDNVTKGGQVAATSYVPQGLTKENGEKFSKDYLPAEGDVEQAKKLLADAGYPNGQGFPKITILYNTGAGHEDVAQAVQDMWKKNLGIEVELKNQEWAVYLTSRSNKEYQLCRWGWVADYADPMAFLDVFTTNSTYNSFGYSNPEFDAKIEAATKELDATKREQLLSEAQDIIMDDMAVIPIYDYVSIKGISSKVKGTRTDRLGFTHFQDAYIEE